MPDAVIQPVILSGGSGSRLWPASRSMYPKQLLPLVSGKTTMLQDTAARLDGMQVDTSDCLVVCNETHRFLVAEQLREAGIAPQVVLEPEGRNTAPAVALAAFLAAEPVGVARQGPQPVEATDDVDQCARHVGFQRELELNP